MKLRLIFSALTLAAAGGVTAAPPFQIDASQRNTLELTIYNQDLALVRESRALPKLGTGDTVILKGVSQQLQPESVRIENAGQVLEQNFNLRLLSQQALLEHYLNQEITLARTNPASGEETLTNVRLLSSDGSHALIERNQQVETIPLHGRQWRFIFPQRPAGLLSEPSLSFRSAGTNAPQTANLSYLTGGLSWHMNYVLSLSAGGSEAQLTGMATLLNNSGTHYPQSNVQLMAGSVLQPRPSPRMLKAASVELMSAASDASAVEPPAQLEAFHLYNLPQPLNLEAGQQKQITLISSDKVPLEREYQHTFYVAAHQDGRQYKIKPNLHLKFSNTEAAGLGQPMPAGNMRVFRPDASQRVQFVGGSPIQHTATDADVDLVLGQAFDINIERRQSLFENTYDGHLVGQELRISNASPQAAIVVIEANFSHPWELERSSLPMERLGSGAARWQVTVPGKGDFPLNFSVRMKTKR